MSKFDIEALLLQLQSFLQSNLSAKLTAITADKGDGLVLAVPDKDAYFLQTMNNKEAAYDPFIWLGVVDAKSVAARGALGKLYSIHIMIVLADQGTDVKITNRMFRYLRALEELITQNFASLRPDVRMDLESLVPVPLTEFGSENFYKATGVQLTVALA